MARWLVKILKTLINTGESGIVYCMECRKYVGLTLTWDVLKCKLILWFSRRHRLTLTWDVLKWKYRVKLVQQLPINFNMGCFEIILSVVLNMLLRRLTLTWDVLK